MTINSAFSNVCNHDCLIIDVFSYIMFYVCKDCAFGGNLITGFAYIVNLDNVNYYRLCPRYLMNNGETLYYHCNQYSTVRNDGPLISIY